MFKLDCVKCQMRVLFFQNVKNNVKLLLFLQITLKGSHYVYTIERDQTQHCNSTVSKFQTNNMPI